MLKTSGPIPPSPFSARSKASAKAREQPQCLAVKVDVSVKAVTVSETSHQYLDQTHRDQG